MGRWLVEEVTSCHATICLIPHECPSCLEYFSLNPHSHKILAPSALLLTSCLSFKDLPTTVVCSFSQLSWENWGRHSSRLTAVFGTSLQRLPSCGLLSTPDGETQLAVTSVFLSPEPCTMFSIYGCPINILKNILFYLFILAVPGLSCSMQDLPSSLRHVGSLVEACGIYFPDQGLDPGSLHWEHGASH